MKNKLFLLLLLVVCYCLPSIAQKTIPPKTTFTPPTVTPKLTKVFTVTLSVDSTTHPNSTATDIYLKAIFTSLGTGTITYTLTDINRQASGTTTSNTTGTLTPGGTGTDVVLIKRGTFVRSAHSYTITTTSPNQVSSNTP
ncbi:MAG: hypothetical protein WDM90_12630 [Ferruginibacter sp.]